MDEGRNIVREMSEWLPRLADRHDARTAAEHLLELHGNLMELAPDSGDETIEQGYSAAVAALADQLDRLIPQWIAVLLETLQANHRHGLQVLAALKAGQPMPDADYIAMSIWVPLVHALRADGSRIGHHLAPLVAAIGTLSNHEDEHLFEMLERAGSAITIAVPAMLDALRRDGIWCRPSHLARALAVASTFDARVLQVLRKMISGRNADHREAALTVLAYLGPAGRPTADMLLKMAGTSEQDLCTILNALAAQGQATPAVLDLLESAMGSTNGYVRYSAIATIGTLKPDPARFVPLLLRACDDEEPLHDVSISDAAVGVLGEYGRSASSAVARLEEFINGPMKGRTVPERTVRSALRKISGRTAGSSGSDVVRRATAVADEPLFPVIYQGHACFVNRSGAIVIETKYDYAEPFSDERSLCRLGRDRVCIDRSGRTVFESTWDEIKPFSEGLAAVCRDDKWGFVDVNGRLVIEPQYDSVTRFSDGVAGVESGRTVVGDPDGLSMYQSGKRGFVDRTGRLIIPMQYDDAVCFHEGLAAVCTGGTMKPNPLFENMQALQDRTYGYIDKTGSLVIPGPFAVASGFCEGLAAVTFGAFVGRSRAGYVDRSGKVSIEPRFTSGGDFGDGLAVVRRRGRRHRRIATVIDRSGRIAFEMPYMVMVAKFSEGLLPVWIGEMYGYLDLRGEVVIEPQFDNASMFVNGLAQVRRSDWYALINREGKIVWGPTTEQIYSPSIEGDWY